MAFTTVTVFRDYDLADGTDPTGTVTFTPTSVMVNGATVVTAPVVGRLDVDGLLGIDLMANNDPSTLPVGAGYRVDELIGGARRTYYVIVPYNAGASVDLSSLDSYDAIDVPDEVTLAALLALKADVTALALKADLTLLAGYQTITTRLTRMIAAPVTVTYAASVTPDASLGCVFRVTATGNLTIADISNGTDGQAVRVEVLASGANRSVTAGGSTTTVATGTWWVGTFYYSATASAWLFG